MDKVQKIKEWISKTQDGLMNAQGNFEYPEHEGAYHILCNLDAYIDSLQEEPVSDEMEKVVEEIVDPTVLNAYGVKEIVNRLRRTIIEPVSEDFENALAEEWKGYNDRGAAKVDALEDNTQELAFAKGFYRGWHYKKEEPVSEDLGEYINKLSKQFPEVSFAKLSRIAVRVAKWQKEHLWKPADGDDLPDVDREVVVLIKYDAQRNIHDEEYPTYRVGFGHRPNPNGWDGKNIDTNEVTHYTPKLYDKGGWNAPNIVYWLDARLPYEENKIIK